MARHVVTFRITSEEAACLAMAVQELRKRKKWKPDYSVSDFIRDAVGEKLDHLERGRKATVKRSLQRADATMDRKCKECGEVIDSNGHCSCFDGRIHS